MPPVSPAVRPTARSDYRPATMLSAIPAKVEESSADDASIAQKGGDFDKQRPRAICIFSSPAHGAAESARESWIRTNNLTRRVVASPIPDLQRDLGESK
jgi:hypothetical protein